MLTIYKASAGSGKTFILTQEYLKLLFQHSGSYRSTLAVTFTNKASAEMKLRIIGGLYELSIGKSPYLAALEESTQKSTVQIIEQAQVILTEILHNYSFFSIETIDSFFQRVIRNFAKETNLNSYYTLELNSQDVLEKAVHNLYVNLTPEHKAYQIIHDFSQYEMSEGKSRNVIKKIFSFSENLFKEDFMQYEQELYALDYTNFYKKIEDCISAFTAKTTQLVIDIESLLATFSLTVDDFSNKNNGFMGRILKAKQGFSKANQFTAAQRVLLDNPQKWAPKNSSSRAQVQAFVDNGGYALVHKYLEVVYSNEARLFFTAEKIKKQWYLIQLLHVVQQQLDEYLKEENVFLISHSNSLLETLIDEQDAPFVYEKIGFYIKNLCIDEFQDTSRMQWKNFKPLLSHVESIGGYSLVVGDVKQSIYRFRSGDWKLLHKEITEDFSHSQEHVLQKNWRSRAAVIDFNNAFFEQAIRVFSSLYSAEFVEYEDAYSIQSSLFSDLYSDVSQDKTAFTKRGGYVCVQILEHQTDSLTKDEYREAAKKAVIRHIFTLHDAGYNREDITFLARGKKEIAEIVAFCNEAKSEYPEHEALFSIVSSEALLLTSSDAVQFIVSFFAWMDNPRCTLTQTRFMRYYSSIVCKSQTLLPLSEFAKLRPTLERITHNTSLFEMADMFILEFGLGAIEHESAYIHAFQDQVFSVTQKIGNSIRLFLEWWDEKSENLCVAQPEISGSMRAMTIHKSKGLQFKVVIMPFVHWDFVPNNSHSFMARTENTPFSDLPILPVGYSQDLLETFFAQQYIDETAQIFLDNLNALYVACTRAEDACYMMCNPSLSRKGSKNMAEVLCQSLDGIGDIVTVSERGTDRVYECGVLPQVQKQVHSQQKILSDHSYVVHQPQSKLLPSQEARAFFTKKTSQKSRNFGLLMHKILEHIHCVDDVLDAVQRCVLQGHLQPDEVKETVQYISDKLSNPQVQGWFTNSYTVLKEQSILLPGQGERRPDRIMISGTHAIVVDYKFTDQVLASHEHQVQEYMNILSNMGFTVEGYVWYVPKNSCVAVS